MEFSVNLLAIIFLLGCGQGLFLAVAILTAPEGSPRSHRYLGIVTLLFAAGLFTRFLDASGLQPQLPWLRTLLWPKEFLYGPLIYGYVLTLTRDGSKDLPGRWHYVPFMVHAILSWSLLILPGKRQMAILDGEATPGWPDGVYAWLLGDVEIITTLVAIGIYLALSLWVLHGHAQRIRECFSALEQINLHWLYSLLWGLVGLYSLYLLRESLGVWLGWEQGVDVILHLGIVALIYIMGLRGLRQPTIFQEVPDALPMPEPEAVVEPERYRRSPLSEAQSAALFEDLVRGMGRERWYLDPTLSLPQLAAHLEVSVHYLSQSINQQSGQNFFDFINGLRVTEAQRRLQEQRALNILTIAMDVGFNSKSAFYTAFKKYAGMTPGAYRKKFFDTIT